MALQLRQAGEVSTVSDADLVADGDKDVTYQIRHLTIEQNREFVKQCTKRVPNKRTHQMEDVTDWEEVSDTQFDYVLADWANIQDSAKQPLACTKENKALLDGGRRLAIMTRAGINEVNTAAERRGESFRPSA
jgi:phospholipid N-methyltransferase